MDAIGAIAGSSLEQTTWLRRNLEVKPSPKIMVDGNSLESDVEGSFIFIFILNKTLIIRPTWTEDSFTIFEYIENAAVLFRC